MRRQTLSKKSKNEAERWAILYSQPKGMLISKMAQLDTLNSKSTIKRKKIKETGLIKRKPGSGQKDNWRRKGVFYFRAFGW